MQTITLFESREEIAAQCGSEPQVMDMAGALELIVPHEDWLLGEFFPFWLEWKRGLGMDEGGYYRPGSGMCEWITREFLQRLAVSARKALPERDVNPAAFEVRLGIPRGFALNGITDGGHSAVLIATRDNENQRTWRVAESQAWEWSKFWTPLSLAVANGVRVVTVVD